MSQHVATTVRYGWNATDLPRWPLTLPLAGYLISWFAGLGNIVWTIAAVIMAAILIRSRGVQFPRGMGIWLIFLLWAGCSIIMVDTGGRAIGAIYRMILYLSATIIAIYVYNSRNTLTPRFVAGSLTSFLAVITAGGYLAIAFPLFVFHTPMSYIVPGRLAANELVAEMVVIRTTQWNPEAWIVTEPRPSAPFLYSNTWGNVYSLVFPIAIAYLIAVWNEKARRWTVLALILASLPPALATLNRGMYIGLLVVGCLCAVQALRNGRAGQVVLGFIGAASAGAIWLSSPSSEAMFARLDVSNSSEDRTNLYSATFNKVVESPIFGFGAPRPSEEPWLPSLGTQGQIWMVMFSYGFIGAALFLGFLIYTFTSGVNQRDLFGTVWTGIILATIIESFYYGMMTGINISLIAAAMLLRPSIQVPPRRFHPRSTSRYLKV